MGEFGLGAQNKTRNRIKTKDKIQRKEVIQMHRKIPQKASQNWYV